MCRVWEYTQTHQQGVKIHITHHAVEHMSQHVSHTPHTTSYNTTHETRWHPHTRQCTHSAFAKEPHTQRCENPHNTPPGCENTRESPFSTGWRRLIGCLKLQVIFRKRAAKYRVLLRKMTCKDKASHDTTPVSRTYEPYTWAIHMSQTHEPNTWAIHMSHTHEPNTWAKHMSHTHEPYTSAIHMRHTHQPYTWAICMRHTHTTHTYDTTRSNTWDFLTLSHLSVHTQGAFTKKHNTHRCVGQMQGGEDA